MSDGSSDVSDDSYVQPSWEAFIDQCFENMKNSIVEYLQTDHFKFEWKHWNAHRAGVCSRFRDSLRYRLGIDMYEKESKFPIKTKTLEVILRVIEHSMCAQFNFMFQTVPDEILMTDNQVVKTLGQLIIEESFNRLEANSHPSLLEDLYAEYKTAWNAAEKIQIQWKRTISDPSYRLCQKRLLSEYKQLQALS